MPRVALTFDQEILDLEIDEGQLLGAWEGPAAATSSQLETWAKSALEAPKNYPPLRQAVVPGDRATIALDADTPQASIVLNAVAQVFRGAGVADEDVKVVTATGLSSTIRDAVDAKWQWVRHDPTDREKLAYLASTAHGRRVYLNRDLVDADFVLPIGRIGHDPVVGRRGPWSMLFPNLSDEETLRSLQPSVSDAILADRQDWPVLHESAEIGWLLGCQFHVGVVPGQRGASQILSGLAENVFADSSRILDQSWTYQSEQRAGLVIAGIQRADGPTRIADIAQALASAAKLTRRGGRIALLSRAQGQIGEPLKRLLDPVSAGLPLDRRLKGLEFEEDFLAARQIAWAAEWADVYLLSDFEEDTFEELSIIALSEPGQIRRLIESSESCIVLNQANWIRTTVVED